jgi:RHS repeat-associated protein
MKNVTSAGPLYFIYTTKEGIKMYYGYVHSKLKNGQNINFSWHLQKVEDLHGNYYEYTYAEHQGEVYLSNILYTKNTTLGLNHYNNITFHYSSRTDKNQYFEAGLSFSQSLLLDKIEIRGEYGNLFKNYIFKYGYNGIFSMLNEVVEQGTDGSELNSTIFKYGTNVETFTTQSINAAPNQHKDVYYGDFDSDGIADMLCHYYDNNNGQLTYTGFAIWKRSTTSANWYQSSPLISTPGNYEFNKQPFTVNSFIPNDFNGDGRSDILFIKTSVDQSGKKIIDFFKIYYPNETATDFTEETIYPPNITSGTTNGIFNVSGNNQGYNFITIGDFDGDGKADFIVVLSNNTGFKNFFIKPGNPTTIAQIENIYAANSNYDGLNILDQNGKLYAIEMNGDGKSELMVVENSQTKLYEVIKNPGNSTQPWKFNLMMTDGYPTKWHDIVQFGDFNGDGKTDVITNVISTGFKELAINNGEKWIGSPLQLEPFSNNYPSYNDHKVKVGDFNGDGKSDYLHYYTRVNNGVFYQDYFDYYISQGNDFQKKQKIGTPTIFNELIIGDFNGDGKDDIAGKKAWNNPLIVHSLDAGFNNQLLLKIKNGHGLVHEFVYSRLNSGESFYTKNTPSSYPLNVLNAPLWCVRMFNKRDGIGGINTNYHQYQNLYFHKSGKGLLGYQTRGLIDLLLDRKIETENLFNSSQNILHVNTSKTFKYSNNELLVQNFPSYQFISLSGGRYKMQDGGTNLWDMKLGVVNSIAYTYDNYGNPLTKTESISNIVIFPGNNPYYTITTTVPSYITSGGLVPTHPSSVTLQKQRFINGSGVFTKTTTFTYNNKAKVLAQTEFSGLPKAVTTNFTYNGFGNLIGQSVAAQNMPTRTESYAYDDKQRFVISQSVPCSSCPGSPTLTEIMNYDPFWGKVTYKKDAQCQQFSNSYDAFGRLSSTTDNYGITSTYSYNWVTGISNQLSRTTIVTPNKPFIQKGYDILGRETATYSQNKDGQTIRSFITYNNKGQKVGETNTHYFSETPLYTNYSYDSYNRLSQVQNFQGTTSTAYEYPAGTKTLKATTTFPDGRTKVQITDATGAIQSVEDGGGLLSYEYNANNEVIVTKKDGISVLSNSYDDYGRINQTIDPNAGTINYEYNAFGDLYRQTDNSGNLTETQYDGLGRTTAIISSEGTIEYEYGVHNVYIPPHITLPGFPPVPGTYCPTQVLTKITGYNGFEQTFTYNDRLRPIIKYETIDGQTYGTFYNYALNGDLLQTTYPSGVTVQNIYNSFGFLTEKKDQNNNSLYQLLATNGMRQATQFKLGNNLTSSISYTNGFPQSYNTAGVQSLQFDFNFASGNLSMRRDLIKNKEEIFTFDHLNRLVSAQVAGQSLINYHYDLPSAQSLGNISAKKDVGNYKYEPSRINAVSSIQNATLTSLPPQNISTDDQRITYTSLQRPATIEEGDYSYELTYAPENERIKTEKRFQGETVETRYYFEGCELIITPNGSKWVTYVNGANGLASMIVTENNIHKNYFTYTDHLGSILTVTNAAGIVVAEQNFDAWGARRDPNTWISLPPQAGYVVDWLSRGYTGHEHLSEFALINMNARLYDPIVGRMLSADNYVSDMFSSQAYNRYTYANNNPMCYIDPDGNLAWFVPVIAGAVIGAYMGGSVANNNFNLFKWQYDAKTWTGIGIGAITGALSGGGWSLGLSAIGQSGIWATAGKVILAGKIVNTVITAASLISNFENGARLMAGRYYTDENRTFGGQLLQGLSRYTWEGFQTWMGYNYTQLRNTTSRNGTVHYLGGATILNRETGSGGWWGVTMGNYMNTLDVISGNRNVPISWENEGIQHEYGHTLQSRIFGPAYFIPIMPWSGISAWLFLRTHDNRWFERGADRNWNTYFRNHLQ